MTTTKRYENDVNLKELETTIISLDPIPDGLSKQYVSRFPGGLLDRPALVLAETIFFPEGGGQPWDLGTIDGVALAGVLEADGVVYHILASESDRSATPKSGLGDGSAPSSAFVPGQTVRLVLDWERRFDHMQRHCGEHILSGIFFSEFGGVNRGFHMGDEYMTIDISLETESADGITFDGIDWDMALHAELLANRAIWQNLPVTTRRFDRKEDAAGIPLRKPLAVDEDISIVCVGSPENPSDCVACCGTHPTTSGQVGLLKIYKVENYKGMFRIYFDAGNRALADYRAKHQLIAALGKKFSAGTEDLWDKIEARETKNTETRNGFHTLRQSVIKNRLDEISSSAEKLEQERQVTGLPKVPIIARAYDDLPPDDLLTIGRAMTGKFKGLLILHFPTAHTLFLFSDGKPDCGKLVKDHLEIYNGKGGGNATSSRIIFSKPEYPDLFIDLLEKHLR